jgi:hypothetical protein
MEGRVAIDTSILANERRGYRASARTSPGSFQHFGVFKRLLRA